VDDASVDISEASSISSRGKKGSSSNLTGEQFIGAQKPKKHATIIDARFLGISARREYYTFVFYIVLSNYYSYFLLIC